MKVQFSGSQSVELNVPDEGVPIQHYLRQPHRLVYSLVDPQRLEQLDQDCFRLKMRPISFLSLAIQPTVDLKVWALSDGTIRLKSVGCAIRGADYINQRFALHLFGRLSPQQVDGMTQLKGLADITVEIELPPALWLTPRPLIETTGNHLLKGILATVKQRLAHHLILDYRRWVREQPEQSQLAAHGQVHSESTLPA
ncbi:MAG: DUF1997 domain-containing protein [Oscillatoriales cyanobacterium RM2_1_1]|nr:DUF1997 domain-containing protein [Oscillatoriales cyanobacterium SM2_3_0]NJO44690.1 DUF1997 domain-containing protein [Oscillatoriales cyanobacterium RM2_1_1]